MAKGVKRAAGQHDQMVHPDAQMFELPASRQLPVDQVDGADDAPQTVPLDQFTALKAQFDELQQNQNKLLEAALTRPTVAAPVIPVQEPEPSINLDGLPDPAQDREGFLKGLAGRMGATLAEIKASVVATASETVSAATSSQQAFQTVERLIYEAHPELQGQGEILDMASRKVANEHRARGGDPMQIIMNQPDKAAELVGAEAVRIMTKVKGLDAQPADDGSDDPQRTEVLGGGLGGSGGRPQPKGQEKAGNFVNELKALQKAMHIV